MLLSLEVHRFLDLEALEHGITVFSFRVWTRVKFKQPDGWTLLFPAVIDTGAPFSVLPKTLWTTLQVEVGFETSLRGLVPLESAVLPARLGQVICTVSDLNRISVPLKFWALLAEGEVPLVLGCSGFLDQATLFLDAAHQRGRLELMA